MKEPPDIQSFSSSIDNFQAEQRNLWQSAVLTEISKEKYASLRPLIEPLDQVYKDNDPKLINLIKQKYLIASSGKNYNLQNNDPEFDPSMGQSAAVRSILNNKVSSLKSRIQKPKFAVLTANSK